MEPLKPIAAPTAKPNPQLFVNSQLRELFAQSKSATSNGGSNGSGVGPEPSDIKTTFFNQRDPNLAILHEKPEHRMLLMLKIRGFKNREIAQQSGYTEAWLSQLFRQPWAVETMARLQSEAGIDAVKGILESEAIPSIMRLVDLRDDPETPAAVVRSACDSLLDRHLGRPTQHVDVVQQHGPVTAETVEELDKEIAALSEEAKVLQGRM